MRGWTTRQGVQRLWDPARRAAGHPHPLRAKACSRYSLIGWTMVERIFELGIAVSQPAISPSSFWIGIVPWVEAFEEEWMVGNVTSLSALRPPVVKGEVILSVAIVRDRR